MAAPGAAIAYPGGFIGRRGELDALARLIAGARDGRSGSLVVRAGAGMGKSYLLVRLVDDHADGMQVLTISATSATTPGSRLRSGRSAGSSSRGTPTPRPGRSC